MKQILQNLKDGSTVLADVPRPYAGRRQLLINTHATLVSAGTERMLVEFGKGNWVQKARQQPDKVRMVLEKMRTDGVAATMDAVRSKLDQPLALGYCNVGTVAGVGEDVTGFSVGDRVASNGKHAEAVVVPENLCARVPDAVSDEAASFTVLGAIGLQGIRLVNPTLGECVVVTGLGLIGLLTVQMLRAQGCRVLGIDLDPERLALAERFGAEVMNPGAGEDVLARGEAFSRGRGVDAVLITASTRSNEPVRQAAQMCRKRGRIVLVGVTGLELSRADFYEKELSFQVSCSYGPGRYDPDYEERGQDYPVGFVRWTEQRNFEAVLDLMASGAVDVDPLISHRFSIDDAADAYDLLASDEPSLGILLEYQGAADDERASAIEAPTGRIETGARTVQLEANTAAPARGDGSAVRVAFLGAGNYAGRVLMPAFQGAGAIMHTVVSNGGVSATHYGKKFGFQHASTDIEATLADDTVDAVVVATRHDAHAAQVLEALRAGKHVFCEKPLCLTREELTEIEQETRARPGQRLMVGFNRRFAPHVVRAKELLARVDAPKSVIVTVNAGAIPADHWTQNAAVGGGRIIGEACHFIDLARHLVGAPIATHGAFSLGPHAGVEVTEDKATIQLGFADGSQATIHYLANGHKGFPKERVEVFAAGRILQLDNFRRLRVWGWPNPRRARLWRQDKGSKATPAQFLEAVRHLGPDPIPQGELIEVSRTAIEVAEDVR
ncbi:bi-domain-containing oxidoreductase [Arhodomonas aquaeolei]|uniref:bi-domain-containing oxidoreductase n=1 Tax=Arhodomonas aquaeolei TaxID=2369 RepID=UPI000379C6D9|nr:bi-domain-containing oxidoreductase [Arhodomonas aquaeolei]